MHGIFDAPVYEFHISYQYLQRPLPDEDWTFLKSKIIIVHCPELFEDSNLLNLCSDKDISLHISNLNRVCDFSRLLAKKVQTEQVIKIVANIGGYSLDNFIAANERPALYDHIINNLCGLTNVVVK